MATQTVSVSVGATIQSTLNGRSTTVSLSSDLKRVLTYGTIADSADLGYYDSLTVASTGVPSSLDLSGGVLIDVNGRPVTFVEVTTLVVANLSTTQTLTVGGGSNYFDWGAGSGTKTLKPGERAVLIDLGVDPGYVVTAGTGDLFKIATGAGTLVPYEILIAGRSA